MDETRRFLRYVVPGLLFATEVLILLSFLRPDWTSRHIQVLAESGGLAVILGGLLASGGLGFLFSMIHHTFHWRRRRWLLWGKDVEIIDHSDLIRDLIETGVIQPRSVKPDVPVQLNNIARDRAWGMTTGLWHQRTITSKNLKGAHDRVMSLVDLMHALGTARVAVFFSPMIAFLIAARISAPALGNRSAVVFFVVALVISILVFSCAHVSYARTGRFAQRVIEQVLTEALIRERGSKRQPIPIYVRGVPKSEDRAP